MKKIKNASIGPGFMYLVAAFVALARDGESIVSTTWLEQNLSKPRVVIVDIGKVEKY